MQLGWYQGCEPGKSAGESGLGKGQEGRFEQEQIEVSQKGPDKDHKSTHMEGREAKDESVAIGFPLEIIECGLCRCQHPGSGNEDFFGFGSAS
jgi:hypothetical protein